MTAEHAPAKINLHLHVTGRRADGYHLLDSLVAFADAGDTVAAAWADALSLSVEGPFAAGLAAEADNLVLRAARALADAHRLEPRARLVLTKRLPVSSGIGGGSADAAAALRALARLWGVTVPAGLAATLGADVPVCLESRALRMQGIGEVLLPAPALPSFGLVLMNPGAAVPTPAVFRARTGPFSPPAALPAGWRDAASMAADLAALRNDLEDPAITTAPVIAEALHALRAAPGCLLARMSGSGATCFGVFADAREAARVAPTLTRPGWWHWGGGTAGVAAAGTRA